MLLMPGSACGWSERMRVLGTRIRSSTNHRSGYPWSLVYAQLVDSCTILEYPQVALERKDSVNTDSTRAREL